MNPYDPYVSNDMVNGKQQHNFWNTGDWKFSHVDPKVNDKFIELLIQDYYSIFEDRYGKITVNCRKIRKYLEITINYTTKGLYKITMFCYIKEILETFDKIDMNVTGTKESTDPTNLMVLRYDCTKIETKNSEQFHKLVAKIFSATKKARLGTSTVILYLTMHSTEPDLEDWTKLKQLMKYIRVAK